MSAHDDPTSRRPRPLRAAVRLAGALAIACLAAGPIAVPAARADDAPAVPTTIVAVSGDGQHAEADGQFAEPLIARVLDQDGSPLAGVEVELSATGPAEFASGATSTVITSEDGTANSGTVFTLDGTGAVTVTATAVGGASPSVSFSLTVGPRTARLLDIVSGDGQSTIFGYAFAEPLVVQAADAQGRPVQPPGASVSFTITSGGSYFPGGATSASIPVAADGTATSPLLLSGNEAGPVEITAEIVDANGSVGSNAFRLTVSAPAPTTVAIIAGDGQRALNGTAFATRLAVEVRDQRTDPVAGSEVTFAISGPAHFAGGSTTAIVTTGTDGTATAPVLTAASAAIGAVTVSATASGGPGPSATFHLAVTSPAATALEIVGGDGQLTYDGLVLGAPLAVKALDANGNPVTPVGATVTFRIESGNATFQYGEEAEPPATDVGANDYGTPTAYETDVGAGGVASTPGMILYPSLPNGEAGIVEVSATIADGNGSQGSATFQLYVASGPPSAIAVVRGNGQQTTPSSVFGAPLVAAVTDSNDFPIIGAPVLLEITSGPATGIFGPGCTSSGNDCLIVTDENGQVSVNVQAGSGSGTVTVAAAAVGAGAGITTQFTLTVASSGGGLTDPAPTTTPTTSPGTTTTAPLTAAQPSAPGSAPAPADAGRATPVGTLARTGPGTELPRLVLRAAALVAAGTILLLLLRRRARAVGEGVR